MNAMPTHRSHTLLAVLGVIAVALGGCDSRSAKDTVTVSERDDVFLGQSPYGLDHSVVILARVPQAVYSGGAIVLTGGRELTIVQPQAWRGYTGLALTAEEATQRTNRAQQTDRAADDLNAAMDDLNRALGRYKTSVQDSYRERQELPRARPTPIGDAPAPAPAAEAPTAPSATLPPVEATTP
jgi:hypothetical protein